MNEFKVSTVVLTAGSEYLVFLAQRESERERVIWGLWVVHVDGQLPFTITIADKLRY